MLAEPKEGTDPGERDTGFLTRERVLALVLIAATVFALYLCYLLARPFLPSLAWATALAVVANPLHKWIGRRIRNADVAAGLAVVIVAIIVVAPSVFVIQKLVQEAAEGVEKLKDGASEGRWRAALERHPRLAAAVDWIESRIKVGEELQKAARALSGHVPELVAGSGAVLVQLAITLFILFFFFRDRGPALQALRALVPLSDQETAKIFSRVTDTIEATIFGTVVVAMIQGALGGLMFWWLGLPAALLWGVVMALLAIVPVLGAFCLSGCFSKPPGMAPGPEKERKMSEFEAPS